MPSELRREFEKAFTIQTTSKNELVWKTALWAAKWMAERCAKEICPHNGFKSRHMFCDEHASQIRELSKELDQCSAS